MTYASKTVIKMISNALNFIEEEEMKLWGKTGYAFNRLPLQAAKNFIRKEADSDVILGYYDLNRLYNRLRNASYSNDPDSYVWAAAADAVAELLNK